MTNSPRNLGRPRQQEQAIPTNERILLVATKLFVEHGYNKVSMDEVALRCNVTKATIYYYFKTKADLFTAAIVALMTRVRNNSINILNDDRPFRERLEQLVITFTYATFNFDVNNFIRESSTSLSAEQQINVHQAIQSVYDSIELCFKKAIEEGLLPQKNTQFMTHLFLTLLDLSKFKNAEGSGFFPTPEETAKEIINFYWNGLQSIEK